MRGVVIVGRVNPQFKAGERAPAGGGDGYRVVVRTAHGPHAVGLGQSVGGEHDVDVEFGLHPFHQHDRDGSRPGHREPQRAQVVLAARRVVQQSLVDGGRPRQHGDAVALDRLQRAQRIERQVRDQRRTRLQASQDPGLVAEVMEERVDAQIAVCTGHLAVRSPRRRARQRLPVRAQHAFAAAGGSGGEQDVADVAGFDGGGARDHRIGGPRLRTVGDEVVPRPVVGVDRYSHDVAQRGQCGAVQVADAIVADKATHSEQHRGSGAGQDVAGFARGVAGVQRHHGCASVMDRQAGDHPMPGVRRPDGHPVSGLDAERDERGGRPVHLVA